MVYICYEIIMDTICAYTRIIDTGSRNQTNESFLIVDGIYCVFMFYIYKL